MEKERERTMAKVISIIRKLKTKMRVSAIIKITGDKASDVSYTGGPIDSPSELEWGGGNRKARLR